VVKKYSLLFNTAKVYFLLRSSSMQSLANDEKSQRRILSMGQTLRTVGQGLESLDVEDFDLREEDEGYFALKARRQDMRRPW
jgi:hypothetical protein